MDKVCVVIPIYNEIPTAGEIKSITRNVSVLKKYDIFAVCPDSMDVKHYAQFGFCDFIRFDDGFFVSNKTYSRLIMSENFYEKLMNYEYFLIAQTDTFIINTDYSLDYFVNMGYDYIGAPWPDGPFEKPYGIKDYIKILLAPGSKNLKVGNGGFSLRNVKKSFEALKNSRLYIKCLWKFNEDLFFSLKLKNKPDLEVASAFALETNMQVEIDKGNYPYALHAYEKHLTKDIDDVLREFNSK